MSSDLLHVDRKVLAEIRSTNVPGEPDLVQELIDLFLEDVPPMVQTLREHADKQELPQLERAAHALKGSCLSLGVGLLGRLCSDLQEVAMRGDLEAACRLVTQAEAEYPTAAKILLEVRDTG